MFGGRGFFALLDMPQSRPSVFSFSSNAFVSNTYVSKNGDGIELPDLEVAAPSLVLR
jgi:hypothetical protein